MLVIPLANGSEKKISVGDKAIITKKGMQAFGMESGIEVFVANIIYNGGHAMDAEVEIARVDRERFSGGGRTARIYVGDFMVCFKMYDVPNDLRVSKKFVFKGKNLEGMRCKRLATLEGGEYFVELEEDVGGCSCDGLGKAGHCVVVSNKMLASQKEKRKQDKKAK